MNREEKLKKFADVDIYPVTCERLSRGRSDIDVLKGVIAGGARIIQLREKEISKREFFRLAVKFREITGAAGLLLIINDHVDIALAVDADGVHLGQDDLPPASARKIAPELIIGVSTHNVEQALRAENDGADYVNIGPVFKTSTKEGVTEFLGVERVKTISKEITVPFTVMGGINNDNISELVRAGAKKVAVVSAITMADDIKGATRKLIEKIRFHE